MDSSEKAKPGRPKGSKDKPRLPGAPPRGRPKKSAEHSDLEGESNKYYFLLPCIAPAIWAITIAYQKTNTLLDVDADDEYEFDGDGLTGADLEELDNIERIAYRGEREFSSARHDS
jgi:hypothetical protein